MNRSFILLVVVMMVGLGALVFLFLRSGAANDAQAPTPSNGEQVATDPQMLLIPRWFLKSLTVNGQEIAVPEGQQSVTLQFQEDGNANGSGGCNNFFATYQAASDGSLTFGPIGATKMACDGAMELETAYFNGLSSVQQFERPEGELVLSSHDGKTRVVFVMPPK